MSHAIAAMKPVLAASYAPILLVTAVAADGTVVAVDAHSWAEGMPSPDVLLRIPRLAGAAGVVFGWRAFGSPRDATVADAVVGGARKGGIGRVSYVVFGDDAAQPALRNVS